MCLNVNIKNPGVCIKGLKALKNMSINSMEIQIITLFFNSLFIKAIIKELAEKLALSVLSYGC